MKILFPIRSTHLIHNHKSMISALLERGHRVHMVLKSSKMKWAGEERLEPVRDLEKSFKTFSYDFAPPIKKDFRANISGAVKAVLTYRRYLLVKNQSRHYLARYIKYLPFWLRASMRIGVLGVLADYLISLKLTGSFLRLMIDKMPASPDTLREIYAQSPDVLLISGGSLVPASMDMEYLEAGVKAGVPTVLPALSWDYVTTKTLIYPHPDRFLVWNRHQVAEAVWHHGIPMEKIGIIGATQFDGWFGNLKPMRSREEFCKENKLDPASPIVVYFGSSFNVAQDERWILEQLWRALRASSDTSLQKTQLVLRPHPMNYKYYRDFNLERTAIVPKEGAIPDTAEARQLFFDTVFHAVAVIGVNTSAMLEAAILGKPIISFIAERYNKTQSEAAHFRALLGAGAMELVRTPEEFAEVVAKLLLGIDDFKNARENFVRDFIRPQGLEKSSGEAAADEIERLIKRY